MKILHTADWHLGKRLESLSRHAEQEIVLNEICEIADRENVDVILIAGDLFDTYNPPNESVELFYKICKRLSNNGLRAVVAIAGNHDSPERIDAPDPLARECGIIFAGFPNATVPPFSLNTGLAVTHSDTGFIALKLPNYDYPLHILLTPFANEERLKKYLGETQRELILRQTVSEKWKNDMVKFSPTVVPSIPAVTLLMSHLLFIRDNQTVVQEDEGEKPIYIGTASAFYPDDVPDGVQYVALGHLHRFHYVAKTRLPVVYSGSPLAYSFNEENQEKYVILIEAEPEKRAIIKEIALKTPKRLFKIVAETYEDALLKLAQVPGALIQLSVKTENGLDRSIIQPLLEAHAGIIPPIMPIFTNDTEGGQNERVIDLNDVEKMFKDYFKFKHKSEPSEDLMQILKEVMGNE